MSRRLSVYFDRDCVGELIQDDGGQMLFQYAADWLAKPGAFPVSQSLPLQADVFPQKACRGFFGGVLPEETNRKVIARILQISNSNDFAMLERIGGECAGALCFVPEGESLSPADTTYRRLTDDELLEVLSILDKRPLLAGERGVRLSLAGAQDKMAVAVAEDGQISLPLNYAPSTHILKPALATWEGIVSNENYCMALASAVGLNAAATSAHRVGDVEYLLSERYDRRRDAQSEIRRLHQEDFCQALGIPSELKYQVEGGPGLRDCFALLRSVSGSAVNDLRELLNAVTFNLLIGNNDAHAKNYSILYDESGAVRLAPLYDLVCTVYYPEIENRLAMKIGQQANPDLVSRQHLEVFAREARLGPAAVRRSVEELAARVKDQAPAMAQPDSTAEQIAALVVDRCERMLKRLVSK